MSPTWMPCRRSCPCRRPRQCQLQRHGCLLQECEGGDWGVILMPFVVYPVLQLWEESAKMAYSGRLSLMCVTASQMSCKRWIPRAQVGMSSTTTCDQTMNLWGLSRIQ